MSHSTTLSGMLESLELDRIDVARVRHHEELFFLLCAASLLESAAVRHSARLIEYFAGNDEWQNWLSQHWAADQLQHGLALTAYVKTVWPEFAWDSSFDAFCTDDDARRNAQPLTSRRGLELVGRCVTATAGASVYRALHQITDEPVLRQLTNHLKNDQLRHYKHFHQHYEACRERESFGRYAVARALWQRLHRNTHTDGELALRHVFNQCNPHPRDDEKAFQRMRNRVLGLLRQNIRIATGVRMLIKPLALPASWQTALERPAAWLVRRQLRR